MHKYSDGDILNGVKSGDENILKYLFRSFYPKIKRMVGRSGGYENDADDVMQDAIIVIYEKLKLGELTINCQFGTYFYGVAKILWIKELKKRGKLENFEKAILETELSDNNIVTQIEMRERQKIYIQYFNKLGDECKKLLELFFNGEKIKDITLKMNYSSEQHTKNRKYICKKKLIESVRSNPAFKEIKNERLNNVTEIPRW